MRRSCCQACRSPTCVVHIKGHVSRGPSNTWDRNTNLSPLFSGSRTRRCSSPSPACMTSLISPLLAGGLAPSTRDLTFGPTSLEQVVGVAAVLLGLVAILSCVAAGARPTLLSLPAPGDPSFYCRSPT